MKQWQSSLETEIQEGLKYVETIERPSFEPIPEWLPVGVYSARQQAQIIHEGQMYGENPYVYHLDAVAHVLVKFGVNDLSILRAAYFHDAMEDRGLTYNDIKADWGTDVANIVYCLTDEKGKNRKERKERTYPALRANLDAVIVKVADRIANMEENGKGSMYAKEFEDFQKNLRVYGHVTEMWDYLAELVKKVQTKETPQKDFQSFDSSEVRGLV